MLQLQKIHHVAVICSDYVQSKHFYTSLLGLTVVQEIYREDRESYKLDLALNGVFVLELFSFKNPPQRPSQPEAAGLRHIAFEVKDIEATRVYFTIKGLECKTIRIDQYTLKKFFFLSDPDGLPLEFYEA